MGAEQAKPVALEDAADAGQEMVVAAAKGADDARHLDHGRPVEPHLTNRGADQPTDQHEIAAALGTSEPAKSPELADRDPAMRIGRDRLRIDEAAQGEQHDPTPAALNRRRDRQRYAAAAADDAQRPLVRRRYRHWCIVTGPSSLVHRHWSWVASSPPRRMAVLSGRLPARMKAKTLSISGTPA
jgi:hypothetical protein